MMFTQCQTVRDMPRNEPKKMINKESESSPADDQNLFVLRENKMGDKDHKSKRNAQIKEKH